MRIIVNEYPKSGGSWIVSMLGDALALPKRDISIDNNNTVLDWSKHPWYEGQKDWGIIESCVIKSHKLPNAPNIAFPAHLVHLVRDGRDVIVSKYFYEKDFCVANGIYRSFDESFDKYLVKTARDWKNYVLIWLKKLSIFWRYEDFLQNPSEVLKAMIRHLGLHVSDSKIDCAIRANTKEKMRQSLKKVHPYGDFVRKGIAGDWRNHFGREHVEVFKEIAGDLLIQLGYEKDFNWSEDSKKVYRTYCTSDRKDSKCQVNSASKSFPVHRQWPYQVIDIVQQALEAPNKKLRVSFQASSQRKSSTIEKLQIYLQNAATYLNQNKYIEALNAVQCAVDLGIEIPELYYTYSLYLNMVGKYEKALEAAKKELVINPGHSKARAQVKSLTQILSGSLSSESKDKFSKRFLYKLSDSDVIHLAGKCKSDAEFLEILAKVLPYTSLTESRLHWLFCLVKQVCQHNLPGNIVECGISESSSMAFMTLVAQRYSRRPRLYFLIDEFADSTLDSEQYAVLSHLGLTDQIQIIKAKGGEMLPRLRDHLGMIAILHTKEMTGNSINAILNTLYDRIVQNGIVQIDNFFTNSEIEEAVKAFFDERNIDVEANITDDVSIWFQKPNGFPINPEVSPKIVKDFLKDNVTNMGIDVQMSPNELFQIYFTLRTFVPIDKKRPLRFVEIGSWEGGSLLLICRALSGVTDKIEGFAIEPNPRPKFRQIIDGLSPKVRHLQTLSHHAVEQLKGIFADDGNPPMFILVDGDHSYEGVKRDIELYYPILAPGGVMVFHDFLPPLDDKNRYAILFHHGGHEPGIRQACQELMEDVYRCEVLKPPLLYQNDPTQTQPHLPIIPGVYSTIRVYRKPHKTSVASHSIKSDHRPRNQVAKPSNLAGIGVSTSTQHESISPGNLMEEARQALKIGDIDASFAYLIRAKRLRKPTRGLDLLRAELFLKMKRTSDAIVALKEELNFFPDNAEARSLFDRLITQMPELMEARIQDAEFQGLYRKIQPFTMVGEARLYSLFSLAKQICKKDIPGHFVECSVAAGGSSAMLATVIKHYSKRPRIHYAFDTFNGMPEPTEYDRHQGKMANLTGWGTGTCAAPESSLCNVSEALGVSYLIRIVKGCFERTLPAMKQEIGQISLLHMDADWYSSSKDVLNNLYDQIIPGGVIQVDDYGFWEGCRKAIDEFEQRRCVYFKKNIIDNTGIWFFKP